MSKRYKKINGFKILLKERKPRKIKYKIRRKPYRTKAGGIWHRGRYYRLGKYGKSRGWIRYK